MPACKRCNRVAATGELRKTPGGGYVCKTDRERCELVARAGEWPEGIDQLAREVKSHAESVIVQCEREDAMRALDRLRQMSDAYAELAVELAKRASREGKTQKQIAAAVGVPASQLRGLKATA